MIKNTEWARPILAAVVLAAVSYGFRIGSVAAQSPQNPPYIVEWVYKVKLGHEDEFWQIFRKYQIATLNKEKERGSVLKYEVFRPGLHTSGDHRWSYRIVILLQGLDISRAGFGDRERSVSRSGHTEARRGAPVGSHGRSLGPSDPPDRS